MVVGIFAMIKDEQFYLEEWIKFHLAKGFDKIVLAEDYGSRTHKHITDKYPQVELYKFDELDKIWCTGPRDDVPHSQEYTGRQAQIHFRILDGEIIYGITNEEREELYRQHPNMHFGMDWCAFLDADEFIEGDYTDIHDVVKYAESINQCAIHLYWKVIGCDGIIKAPQIPYSSIDTYHEVSEVYSSLNNGGVKSIGNLNDPELRWEYPPHSLIRENGDFIDNSNSDLNLYINHYITRSYEEYMYLKMNRSKLREKEQFFFMNDDKFTDEELAEVKEVDKKYYEWRRDKAKIEYDIILCPDDIEKLHLIINAMPFYDDDIFGKVFFYDNGTSNVIRYYYNSMPEILRYLSKENHEIFVELKEDNKFAKKFNKIFKKDKPDKVNIEDRNYHVYTLDMIMNHNDEIIDLLKKSKYIPKK